MDTNVYHTIKRVADRWNVTTRQIQSLYDSKNISVALEFGQKLAKQILTDKLTNGQAVIEKYKNRKEMYMADTQITILGMSGAGKTCYLLGLYYKMGSGMKGYTITTDEDTDVQLRDRYAKMCDQSLGMERFPVGTDNISKYTFNLECGYKPIMSFDWVDYPGGILDRKNEGNLDEYEDVKKSINKSSSLFVCVDGSLLVGDDTDEKIDRVKDGCSAVINTFFSEYFASNNQLPPTAFVVTKYDLCSRDTDEEELCEIIEEAFSPFFVKDGNKRIVTIIPVSIGKNIMDNDCSGRLKPMNIHLPVFMGIWFALSKKIQDYAKKIDLEKDHSSQEVNKLRDQRSREENKWFFKSKDEIQRLANLIISKESSNAKKHQEMQELLNAMTNNSDKLIKELEKIPYVYINGERSSFSGII